MRSWCSLVNTSPCHGEDRRFKSGRPRKVFRQVNKEFFGAAFGTLETHRISFYRISRLWHASCYE